MIIVSQSIAIIIFVLVMMYIEIKDAHKIKIKARTNYVRMIMASVIGTAAAIIFWPNNLSQQIELITISALILFYGFVPEGLGKKQVVKIGTLDGDYNRYKKIEIEPEDKKNKFTRINFFVRKNNSTSLVVNGDKNRIFDYLKQSVSDSEKVQFRRFESTHTK